MLQGANLDNMYAKSISISPGKVNFAFQHEVGHAVETFVKTESQKNSTDFSSGFQNIYNEAQGSNQVRAYAKSKPGESWAESFSNYYCSAEAKSFIASQMPNSYGFLQSVLLPSLWDANSSPSTPNPNNSAIAFAFTPSLSTGGDSGAIMVSGAKESFSFEICENTAVADCASGVGNYKKIINAETKGSRKYFIAQDATTISEDLKLTIIGRDKSNKLIASKVVKLGR